MEMRRLELQQLFDKPTKKNRTRFIQRVALRSALGQNPHHLAHAKIVAGSYFLMK
jgi:hypothetical protein